MDTLAERARERKSEIRLVSAGILIAGSGSGSGSERVRATSLGDVRLNPKKPTHTQKDSSSSTDASSTPKRRRRTLGYMPGTERDYVEPTTSRCGFT